MGTPSSFRDALGPCLSLGFSFTMQTADLQAVISFFIGQISGMHDVLALEDQKQQGQIGFSVLQVLQF